MNHYHQHILRCFTIMKIGRWHHLKPSCFAFSRGCFHFTQIYGRLVLQCSTVNVVIAILHYRLIKELFSHAIHQDNRAVIFIDEIDSICRQRSSREEEHTRRVKTELLRQMEGADNMGSNDKIFLLCATNCPWELDTAFIRRFQKRIHIPLPDEWDPWFS